MKKKRLFILSLMMFEGIGMAHAQKAYTYIQQIGTAVPENGVACYDLDNDVTMEFDQNGNAIVNVDSRTVAQLKTKDGAQLAVQLNNPSIQKSDGSGVLTPNEISVKINSEGYATLYSPFLLTATATGTAKIYAPTFDQENMKLVLNSGTEILGESVIPFNTGLMLKSDGEQTVNFTISAGSATDNHVSDLSGSVVKLVAITDVAVSSGNTIYTLGHETTTNEFGFFKYTGEYLNPGKAFLVAPIIPVQSTAKFVHLYFGNDITAISSTIEEQLVDRNGIYLENGRIVIVKNGKKYNTNGQEMR